MKFLKAFSGIILCLLVALGGNTRFGLLPPIAKFIDPFHGFWQNVELGEIDHRKGLAKMSGLINETKLTFDEKGIPHVFANNDHDLYYLQGYLSARDRLWQMEFQTHAAAGRLSEIVGAKAKDFDIEQRRIGMVLAAQRALDSFKTDELSVSVLEAYTAGVNHYIHNLDENAMPLEYKLLDYVPEPWTPLKSSLLLKYMAKMLTGTERDRPNTEALRLLGPETFELLYPEQNYLPEPIVPEFGLDTVKPKGQLQTAFMPKSSWSMPDLEPHFVGSNNWVVSGKRTQSGNPILANDPHLGLSLPSIWYEIQLNAPGVNCYGVSLPGAPGIILGFNDSITWGVTNAGRDVKDYYALLYKDRSKKQYKFGDDWLTTSYSIEEIKIRGEKSIFDTLRITHFGPVAYTDKVSGQDLALRWTAHDASNEMLTFYKMNRATSFSDYQEALSHYQCPPQNFAYADVAGNIGLWQQGKLFNKPEGHGKFILDGSDPAQEATEFIPMEHNLHMVNPRRGFVSSANQPASDTAYPYYYTGVFEEFRNRTINQFLRNDSSVTIEDIKSLQLNNYNLLAAEALPVLISYIDTLEFLDTTQERGFPVLLGWDYWNNPGLIAPTLFEIWWEELNNLVWDEFNREDLWQGDYYRTSWEEMMKSKRAKVDLRDDRFVYPMAKTLIRLLEEDPENDIFDHRYTPDKKETAKDIIRDSFYWAAVKFGDIIAYQFSDPRWGRYKATRARHLARIDAFGSPLLIVGGSENAPNAMTSTHGPSWRMIVEMTPNGPEAIGVLPGGQSGNPGSKNYMSSLESWTKGEYYQLDFLKLQDLESAKWDVITIKPEVK